MGLFFHNAKPFAFGHSSTLLFSIIILLSISKFNQSFIVAESISSASSWTVSQGGTTIVGSTTVTLTFQLQLTTNLIIGDYILVTMNSPGAMTSSSSTCSFLTPAAAASQCVTSVQVSKSTVIIAANQALGPTVRFSIGKFTNPPSIARFDILIQTYDSAGTILRESGTATITTLTPATMTSASIVPNSAVNDNQVGMIGATILITFKTSQPLLSSGRVQVTFPTWNSQALSQNQYPMVGSTSPTCTGKSNLSPTQCSFSNNILVLNSVVSTTMPAATTFSFTVDNVRNPYNGKVMSGFTIATQDMSGYTIEQYTLATYQVSVPSAFSILALSNIDPTTIGSNSQYLITYSVDNLPIDASCQLVLVGPAEIDIATQFRQAISLGGGTFSNAFSNTVASIPANSLTITGCSTYTESNTDTIQIEFAINPGQVMDSSSFKIYLYALSGSAPYPIAQDLTQLYVSKSILTPNALTSVAVAPSLTTVVQETTPYLISFTLGTTLKAASVIKIQFPTTDNLYKLTSTTSCTLSSLSGGCFVSNPSSCQISSSNLITITNPFGSSSCAGGTDLQFQISQGVNPTSVTDSGTYTFNTYNTISGSNYLVDTFSASGLFTPTVGLISAGLAVTSSSYVTYDNPVTYTVQVQFPHQIPKNGILKVTIPLNSISVFSQTSLTTHLQFQSDTNSAQTAKLVSYSSSTGIVTVTDAFSGSAWVPGSSGTLFKVILDGLINPTSKKQSQSFEIASYDASGNIIDKVTNGLSIIMTGVNELNSVTAVPTSFVNGQTTTYTITINSKTPMSTGDQFTLTFPSELLLPGNPITCTPTSPLSSMTCVQSGSATLSMNLTFSSSPLASGISFSFTLGSIRNPQSTTPSSAFSSVETLDSSSQLKSGYSSALKVTTTTPAPMLSPTLSQVNQQAGVQTVYSITATSINPIPLSGIFVVSYPTSLTVSTSPTTCSLLISTVPKSTTCTINTSNQQITLTPSLSSVIPSGTSLTLKFGPVTNPLNSASSSLTLTSYTDSTSSYSIDTIQSGLVPFILCTFPCYKCLTTDSTQCTACYTDGTTNLIYLYNYYCFTVCPTGYYADSTNTCQLCDSKCLTCSGSSTNCLTCDSTGSYAYFYSNMCYNTCPSNTYLSGFFCIACSLPCLACTASSNGNCITCSQIATNSLIYLSGTTCISSCPSGTFAASSTNICLPCTSPCLTCNSPATSCTSCVSGYSLYGNSCITPCPSGYLDQSQVCTKCSSPCATCQDSLSYCLTCVSGYVLSDNTCSSLCNTGYVSISGKCKQCTSPCLTCIVTQSQCTACVGGYNLYGTTCVSSCPDGYVALNQICQQCTSPCSTCYTSQSQCNSCVNGYYLYRNTCYNTCPSGTIASSSSAICVQCTNPCNSCGLSLTDCTSCVSSYSLSGNSCLLTCPSGTVSVSQVCQSCTSPCATCQYSDSSCLTCINGYFLQSTSCVSICQAGTVYVSGSCLTCTSPCVTCSVLQTNCNSCTTGYSLSGTDCVTTCPSGTISVNKVCVSCSSPCASCSTLTSVCTSCISGYYLQGNTCVLSCNTGYVPISGVCTLCTSPCLTCTITNTVCLNCIDNYYLYGTSCVRVCPITYISNQVTMKCDGCDPNCYSCVSENYICNQCYTGFILFNNVCYTKCPTGYTYSSTLGTCTLSTSSSSSVTSSSSSSVITSSSSSGTTSSSSSLITSSSSSDASSSSSGVSSSSSSSVTSSSSSKKGSSSQTTSSSSSIGSTSSSTPHSSSSSIGSSSTSKTNITIPLNQTNLTLQVNLSDPSSNLSYPYTYLSLNSQLYYFPHLMTSSVGHFISVGSFFKDRSSSIVSNSIAFQAPIETIGLLTQIGLSYFSEKNQMNEMMGGNSSRRQLEVGIVGLNVPTKYKYPLITLVTAYSLVMLLLINGAHFLMHYCSSALIKDQKFKEWKRNHRKSHYCVQCCACFCNFKIGRLTYSRFLGHSHFDAEFEKRHTFHNYTNCLSILCIILVLLPLIFIDVWGLSVYGWGSQFYISLVESLIMSIVMAIMIILDFRSVNKKAAIQQQDENNKMLEDSSVEPLKLGEINSLIDKKFGEQREWLATNGNKQGKDDDFEKTMRREALEKIIKSLPKDQLVHQMSNDQDQLIQESILTQKNLRRFSHIPDQNSNEDDENRHAYSYPATPLPKDEPRDPSLLYKTKSPDVSQKGDLNVTKSDSLENKKLIIPEVPVESPSLKQHSNILDLQMVQSSSLQDQNDDTRSVASKRTGKQFKKGRGKTMVIESEQLIEVMQDEDEPEAQQVTEQNQSSRRSNLDKQASQDEDSIQEAKLLTNEDVGSGRDSGVGLLEKRKSIDEERKGNGSEREVKAESQLASMKYQSEKSINEHQSTAEKPSNKSVASSVQISGKGAKVLPEPQLRKVSVQESIRSDTKMTMTKKQTQPERLDSSEDNQTITSNDGVAEKSKIIDMKKMSTMREETKMGQKMPIEILQEEEDNVNLLSQEDLETKADKEMETFHLNQTALPPPSINLPPSQSRLSQKMQDQEERKLMEEIRSQNQSKVNNWVADGKHELQNNLAAISKLSRYEEELGLNQQQDGEVEDFDEEDQQEKSKSVLSQNLINAVPVMLPDQDGRISTMMNKFEKENPDLVQQIEARESLLTMSEEQRLSPMPIECPPKSDNRNFNEYDILGEFERDTRGNLILLENPKGQIVDNNGRLVNGKGYLIDGKNGNVIERVDERTMFRKSELDDQGDLPAPFSIEKHNFNPLEILGHLDFNPQTLRPLSLLQKEGNLVDKCNKNVNRSGFMIDPDGNLVDRKGRKKFDRRLLGKNDDLPMLLNYKGKKFDIKEVIGDFERDQNGDALIKKAKDGKFRDKQGRLVNQRGYLTDDAGNIIDRKGKTIFENFEVGPSGEFPKIFPFSKFNIESILGDFEVDPLGNPILLRQGRGKTQVLLDNNGRRVNPKGYLIDEKGNVIDKRGNKVFDAKLLSNDEDIPKVFRKGLLRKDTGDSFSRIMSEIEELERRQGSDYENEYPIQASSYPVNPNRNPQYPMKIRNEEQKYQMQDEDPQEDEEDGGNTSIESLMEDTPSNYNIANQRFEHNYYEVEEIVEDGKEEKYDEQGNRIQKLKMKKRILRPKKKKNNKNENQNQGEKGNLDRDALMGQAYGEKVRGGKQQPGDYSKLSNLANSLSGFYRDHDRHNDGGLSTRMKESEVARKIPNFKDKRMMNGRRDSADEQNVADKNDKSMMSLYSQSQANFNTMLGAMQRSGNGEGGGKKRIKGMETIYLQRLETAIGKAPKKGQLKTKARFRDCLDRVYNDPEILAEDLTVKDELEGLILDNYKQMTNQFGQNIAQTSRYVDLKKYQLMKDKIVKETSSHDSGMISGRKGSNQVDDEGLNIFHGNRRGYEKEQTKKPKIDIGRGKKH